MGLVQQVALLVHISTLVAFGGWSVILESPIKVYIQ